MTSGPKNWPEDFVAESYAIIASSHEKLNNKILILESRLALSEQQVYALQVKIGELEQRLLDLEKRAATQIRLRSLV